MRCPKCGGYDVKRSRARSTAERFTQVTLGFHFYRCHSCGWRKKLARFKPEYFRTNFRGTWRDDRPTFLLVAFVLIVVTVIVLLKKDDSPFAIGPMTPKPNTSSPNPSSPNP